MSCMGSFEAVCQKIIQPSRKPINQHEILSRKIRSKIFYQAFTVSNRRKQKLSVIVFPRNFALLPTLLYLHGNGGHKLESLQLAHQQINLVAFDFSACGKSEGTMLSYGQNEVDDIQVVMDFIAMHYCHPQLKFSIWGRSMGGSIAMMYASLHETKVEALILDGPFRQLRKVINNVADHSLKSLLPNFLIEITTSLVESRVNQLSNSNIFEHDYLLHLNLIKAVPILFAFSSKDSVVREEDVKELYQSYRGPKRLVEISAMHHQDRPKQFNEYAIGFMIEEREKEKKMGGEWRRGIQVCRREMRRV